MCNVYKFITLTPKVSSIKANKFYCLFSAVPKTLPYVCPNLVCKLVLWWSILYIFDGPWPEIT